METLDKMILSIEESKRSFIEITDSAVRKLAVLKWLKKLFSFFY